MPVLIFLSALYALFILQEKIYKRFWNKNLYIDFSLSGTGVFEGGQITVKVTAANMKYLPLPWVNIRFTVPHHIDYFDGSNKHVSYGEEKSVVYALPMNKSIGKKYSAICRKRGYYRIDGFEISSGDFLLARSLRMRLDLIRTVTVYPRLIEIDPQIIPYRQLSGMVLAKRFIDPDPFEFRSVREYQPYDSFKQINFKATAKTGEIMSNTYDFTVSREISIVLNTDNYSVYHRDFVHEHAIRLAASLAEYYIGQSIPVSMRTSGADIISGKPSYINAGLSAEHLTAIYEMLARIDLKQSIKSSQARYEFNEFINSNDFTQSTALVLISSKHDEEVKEIYERFKGNILWIIPLTAYDIETTRLLPEGDGIVVWEVEDE